MKLSIKEGRKLLKDKGFKLKAVANPFKSELKSLSVISREGREVNLSSVMTVETHEEFREALEIAVRIEANTLKEPNV